MVVLVTHHLASPAIRSTALAFLWRDESAVPDSLPMPSRMSHEPAGVARVWAVMELRRRRGTRILSLKTGLSSMPAEQRIPWTTKPILIWKIRTLQSSATHQNARLRLYPHPRNLRVVGSSLVSCVCPASAEAESVAHRPDGVAETHRKGSASPTSGSTSPLRAIGSRACLRHSTLEILQIG